MKVNDKVIVIKPYKTEYDISSGGVFWVQAMNRFIGSEAVITGKCVMNPNPCDGNVGDEYYYIDIDDRSFVWRAEWLFADEEKKLSIDEVIAKLEVYVECDHDEYSFAIEELINVHMVREHFSDDLTKAIETQLRGALKFFEANFNIKKRTINTPSYTERYLEEK